MAQAALYHLTQVDVRRATQTDTSRALIIAGLTMPTLTLVTSEHNPGGGVMAVNFAMPRVEAPEPAFSAKGIDTDVFTGMGEVDRWTFAGAYQMRGPGQNRVVAGRAVIEGVITAWEPDESDPTEFQGCTHTFSEVTHYEFNLDGKELFYVDFWEREIRFGGKSLMTAQRQGLGA